MVLGVIVVLVAIVLSAGVALSAQSRTLETRRTLELLHNAVHEWQLRSGRSLTWWQPGDPLAQRDVTEVHGDTEEIFIISEIINRIERTPEVAQLLASIPEESMFRYRAGDYPDWVRTPGEQQQMDAIFDGSLTVLDAWERPIYAIHPGRPWRDADLGYHQRDPDGTIRTYNEHRYGVAPNRQIVFVSAGPDRLFGLDEEFAALNGPEREQAKARARQDNLFSIEVKPPQ